MNYDCYTQQCITTDETYHISRTYQNTTYQIDPKVIVHWTGHLHDRNIFLDSKEVCGKKLAESCILTSSKEYYQVISEFISSKTIASFVLNICNPDHLNCVGCRRNHLPLSSRQLGELFCTGRTAFASVLSSVYF